MDAVLWEACAVGDCKKVKELLLDDPSLVNKQHSLNGWSALHWAAKRNHDPIVELLLASGADQTQLTKDGQLPQDLTTSPAVIGRLTGNEHISNPTRKADSSSFIPNYLAAPGLPTYHGDMRDTRLHPHKAAQSPCQTLTRPTHITDAAGFGEVVLKARVAGTNDLDFIEVELDMSKRTYNELKHLLATELGVRQETVSRIRKLPDTWLRKDKDVQRLKDYQEIELILSDAEQGFG